MNRGQRNMRVAHSGGDYLPIPMRVGCGGYRLICGYPWWPMCFGPGFIQQLGHVGGNHLPPALCLRLAGEVPRSYLKEAQRKKLKDKVNQRNGFGNAHKQYG